MSEELRENKMGTMPVRRLVLSMSLPMMIAMLVQALYNVVDSYFVAKLSENALTAVGMVFPFQNLMIAVGAPSIILNSIGSVMTFGMNQILFAFSSTAVAVFNVYFKLQSFVFMPVFGLNNGMVPIVSYNYGARKRKRLVDTVKFSALLAVAIMLVGLVVIQLFPANILGLFEASPDMLAIGVPALRIISLCFVFAGFSIICSSTFQALGNGLLSMMISIVRQLLILLPAAFFLSLSGSVTAVWWAFPIAELASLALCVIFLRRIYRRVILPLE